MIRVSQLKLPVEHSEEQFYQKIEKSLKIKKDQIKKLQIVKKSIDARKKPDISIVYSVDVWVDKEEKILKHSGNKNAVCVKEKKYKVPEHGTERFNHRPVVIGAGPAGLFCAYLLAREGYRPLVFERGKKVGERTEDVLHFWKTGVLNPASNVQFGEGGAGTFSDGKLNTLVKDPLGRNRFVLDTFVSFGAPEKITYENKPHIGTDILSKVIAAMREEILHLGGTFEFESCVTDIRVENQKIKAVEINHNTWMETEVCVLALGHSARDTFEMLHKTGLFMEPKAFAVGFRVEHPQRDINRSQYGEKYAELLEAAPYKVTANLANGRGVYSFCMCPGGFVVNASSGEGQSVVNGMSNHGRDEENANSAIVVNVTPEDFAADGFADYGVLAGVEFQKKYEHLAYEAGNGKIPVQLFADYKANRVSTEFGSVKPNIRGGYQFATLNKCLPAYINDAIIEGILDYDRKLKGFSSGDAVLSGIESRTSSPVRIVRDETYRSDYAGLFPCGEGAGYAGGITSAAVDGIKVAEAVAAYINNIV